MTAAVGIDAVPPVDTVLICHREPLLAAAAAALVAEQGTSRRVEAVGSVAELLSRLGHGVQVAVVFDGIGEEIADLCEAMRHRGRVVPVLVVSADSDPDYAAGMVESGAAGVVPALGDVPELSAAILAVRDGRIVIPAGYRAEVLDALRCRRQRRADARRRLSRLSPLDLKILGNLCDGMTVARIAERLLLSPHTVRGRVRAIGGQLGVRGQLGIAAVGRELLAAARQPLAPVVPVPAPVAAARVSAERRGVPPRSRFTRRHFDIR